MRVHKVLRNKYLRKIISYNQKIETIQIIQLIAISVNIRQSADYDNIEKSLKRTEKERKKEREQRGRKGGRENTWK